MFDQWDVQLFTDETPVIKPGQSLWLISIFTWFGFDLRQIAPVKALTVASVCWVTKQQKSWNTHCKNPKHRGFISWLIKHKQRFCSRFHMYLHKPGNVNNTKLILENELSDVLRIYASKVSGPAYVYITLVYACMHPSIHPYIHTFQ